MQTSSMIFILHFPELAITKPNRMKFAPNGNINPPRNMYPVLQDVHKSQENNMNINQTNGNYCTTNMELIPETEIPIPAYLESSKASYTPHIQTRRYFTQNKIFEHYVVVKITTEQPTNQQL